MSGLLSFIQTVDLRLPVDYNEEDLNFPYRQSDLEKENDCNPVFMEPSPQWLKTLKRTREKS